MGALKAKKSFKKFAHRKLSKVLKIRPEQRKDKRELKERHARRAAREEQEDAQEDEEHRKTIQNLKEQDPEFHKYLAKEEPDVLKFGDELDDVEEEEFGSDEEIDENAEEAEEVDEEDQLWEHEDVEGSDDEGEMPDSDKDDDEEGLNAQQFSKWLRRKNLKMICIAFRAATAAYEGDKERLENTPSRFRVTNMEVADVVMAGTFKNASKLLDYHLDRKTNKQREMAPHTFKAFHKVKVLIHSIISTAIRALQHLVEGNLLTLALNSCIPLIPYLEKFAVHQKKFLKRFLKLVVNDTESVRFQAFLCIRELAKAYKYPFTDLCMKGMFLTLVRNTKFFNRANLNVVSFLMNCVVVLWGEDLTAAYQQAFIYIRQLAIYLRTALKSPSQENFQPVYNWQFVNSYRVLSMVVCQYVKPNQLWPLVYPLCQIGTGVLDLFPSPKCFPLHLNMIGILNRIARSSGVYIPVPPYLLRIISSPEFQKKYTRSKPGDAPDLICTLRAKTPMMKVLAYQGAILTEALYYLVEHLALHAHTISFPELAYPAIASMSALKKKMQMYDWQAEVRDVMKEIEKNVTFIKDRRKGVSFGPKDSDKVTLWETETKSEGTPLSKYYQQVHEQRTEQLQTHSLIHAQKKRRVLEDEMEAADDDEGGDDDDVAEDEEEDDEEDAVFKDEGETAEDDAEMEQDDDDEWEDGAGEGKRGGRRKLRASKKGRR